MSNLAYTNNLVLKIDVGADAQISMIEKCIQKQIKLQNQQPIPPILPILNFELTEVYGKKHFQVTYDCSKYAKSLLEIFKDGSDIPKVELNKGLFEISQYLKSNNITHQNLTPSNLIVSNKKIYLNNFGSEFNLEKNFQKVTDPLNWLPYLNKNFQLIQQKKSNAEREEMIKSLTDAEIIAQEQFALLMMRAQLFVPIPEKNSPLTLEDSIKYINDWVEGKYNNEGFVDHKTIEDIKENLNLVINSRECISSIKDSFFPKQQTDSVLKNQIPYLERQNLRTFLQLPNQLPFKPVWIYYLKYEELQNNYELIAQQKNIDRANFQNFLEFYEKLYKLLKENSLLFSQFEKFYQNLEQDHLKYLCLKSLDKKLQVQTYFKGWGNIERKKLSKYYEEINNKEDIWKDVNMQNPNFSGPKPLMKRQFSIIITDQMPPQPQPDPNKKIEQYSQDLKFESYYYFYQKQLLRAKDYYAFVDLNQQNSIQKIRNYDMKYLIMDGTIFIGSFKNGMFFGEIVRDVTQFIQYRNINQEKRSRIIHFESISFEYDNEQNCKEFIKEKINSSQFNTRLNSKKCEVIVLERCFSEQDTLGQNFLKLQWDKKFSKLHEYKGQMVSGKYQGEGEIITYNTNPVMKYSGDFNEGKKNGFGILEVIDECIQKGDFHSYEGNFKDDKYHDDSGKIYYDNEKLVIQQGKFVNGKKVGIHTLYYRDRDGNDLQKIVKIFIPIFCCCTIRFQFKENDD